jgi:D-xylose 1-dehydrogenase
MSPVDVQYPTLRDRTVFITGGGSGIGAEFVRAFSRQGCQVAFVDIKEPESLGIIAQLESTVEHVPLFLHCDISDVAALKNAISRAGEAVGEISILINNAANDARQAIEEVTVSQWDEQMAVNQRPFFFAAQAVIPQMRRLGFGSIINLGSITWKIMQAGMPGYSMAKASVHGLTRSLARSLGPFNIRVNTLVPGWVMTERQIENWVTPEAQAMIDSAQCLKARLLPRHIASMALFLAADDSALCTAQEFIVDGGWA